MAVPGPCALLVRQRGQQGWRSWWEWRGWMKAAVLSGIRRQQEAVEEAALSGAAGC